MYQVHRRAFASLAALLLLGVLAGRTAHAEDLWCGDKIITNGMTTFQVRAACGPPVEVRVRPREHHRRSNAYGTVDEFDDAPGEYWTYNFGSTRLMQRLLFVNGVLAEARSLTYGYDP